MLLDPNAHSRLGFSLLIVIYLFIFIAFAYLIIKNYSKFIGLITGPIGINILKYLRYLCLCLSVFVLVFLNRVVPSNGADFGIGAFVYFVLLIGCILFNTKPWEKIISENRNILPLMFQLLLLYILSGPVVSIIRSF